MAKKIKAAAGLVAAVLALAGCHSSTPQSVGTIGGVDIPAGTYLLAQMQAVDKAASLSGEASVKDILAATVTPEDAPDTTQGARDYIKAETMRNLDYYAAVRTRFEALGEALDEEELQNIEATADQIMASAGELYEANGVGRVSVVRALTVSSEGARVFDSLYGEGGSEAVTEQDYLAYLDTECVSGHVLYIPLTNTEDPAAEVGEEAKAAIRALAGQAAEAVNAGQELSAVSQEILPQVFAQLGMEAPADLTGYLSSPILLPSSLAGYEQEDGTNPLKETAAGLGIGEAAVVDLGARLMVLQREKATDISPLETIKTQYSLLHVMRGDVFTQRMNEEGAAMEHALSESAMKAYPVSGVKLS